MIRQRHGVDTIVEIPKEIEPFTKDTFINCNNVKTLPLKYIKDKYVGNDLKISSQLSEGLVEKVIRGVHKSKMISEETKKFLPQIKN